MEPEYLLGNIKDTPMVDLVGAERQVRFGLAKRESLPEFCRSCEVRFACHGGCPKYRFTRTPQGDAGLNYLCSGYRKFFNHIDRPMRMMSDLLRQGRPPAEMPAILAAEETDRFGGIGRNDTCPRESGLKYKKCHGAPTAR